jgi:protein MAK11
VVDYGIAADRSEPKNYQRLLNGEVLLIFLPCPCLTLSQDLKVLHTLDHAYRIHDVKFTQRVSGGGELLLVAAEDKKTTVYEVSPDTETILRPIAYLVGHGNRCVVESLSEDFLLKGSYRVKAIDTIRLSLPSSSQGYTTIMSTVSSDGTINVYDLSLLPPPAPSETAPEISPVVTYDTKGSRLTCVTLADGEMSHLEPPTPSKAEKRRRGSDSEREEEEEEEWQGL